MYSGGVRWVRGVDGPDPAAFEVTGPMCTGDGIQRGAQLPLRSVGWEI